ncbi:MAG TPA: hypothetical protein VGS07_24415 [Thermoanaerobaculia bacterium]|jgi:antitoxin HicB|nr:hypothetical protein [Thermoanaerobaculia bacterium]
MKLDYPYTLEPQEGGGFVVQFLDIEEAFTEGATPEECVLNASEVLTGILEQRLADGAEIPLPGEHARQPLSGPTGRESGAQGLRPQADALGGETTVPCGLKGREIV